MKKRIGLIVAAAFTAAPVVHAADEAQKQVAIDKGLEHLAQTQQADGRWVYWGGVEDAATTGASVLAFLEEGYQAGVNVVINGNNYGDVVGKGMNYLLQQATPYAIVPQIAGNPDSDGNGIGVKFVPYGDNGRDTYVTGLVLPAIARSGTPNQVVTVGPLAGRTDGSGPLGQWTYKDVVRNTVDYFAYGQNDSGYGQGGWRYYANSGDSDNSTAQWPAIGMLFAEGMGVPTPQFVKNELNIWIDHIQYRDGTGLGWDGASGYDYPTSMPNEAKTGGLLVEMYLAGAPLSDADVQAAIAYINRQWQTGPSGWDGNFGHPYAMWAIYKGLEVTIGLDDTTHITNLHPQTGTLDPGDTWNWYEDYCEWLVTSQGPDGSWGGYAYWGDPLSTAWNINILNATRIAPGVPDPGSTVLLLGPALLALAAFRRKE